jgi:hypothetical protein
MLIQMLTKIPVLQSLLTRHSLFRIILQQPFNQFHSLLTSIFQYYLHVLLLVALRDHKALILREFIALRPLLEGGSAEYLHDLFDLIEFTAAREERHQHVHLGHDAPDREDIYFTIVRGTSEDNFGGTVPTGGDVVSARVVGGG